MRDAVQGQLGFRGRFVIRTDQGDGRRLAYLYLGAWVDGGESYLGLWVESNPKYVPSEGRSWDAPIATG